MDLEQIKKEKVIDEKDRKLNKLNDEILHLQEKKDLLKKLLLLFMRKLMC